MAGNRKPGKDWIVESRLWLVLDMAAAAPRDLPAVTELGIAGGVDVILCRIKNTPLDVVASQSAQVRQVCKEHGTPFVMSHFPELAVKLNADAVQIGVSDPPVEIIRKQVAGMPVGYSSHGIAEAKAAIESGADYVFLGPVFPTPEKLKYGDPIGLGPVTESQDLARPVICIGGINHDNIDELIGRGAQRAAVISAIQRAVSPEDSARSLKVKLQR